MSPLRILIVEDECFVGWGLQASLRAFGHEIVAVAESADEALERCRELKPDVVLMDIGLYGEGSGLQAAETISRSDCACKIIFTSAQIDESVEAEIERLGAFGSLTKPYRERDLLALLQRAAAELQAA